MDNRKDCVTLANGIASEIEKLRPIDCNIVAILTAQLLCDGKDKRDLQDLCQFLQLLSVAIKTYMC